MAQLIDSQHASGYRVNRPAHRRFRLFACLCCHYLWDVLDQAESRFAVGMSEAYADGLATERDRQSAWKEAHRVAWGLGATGIAWAAVTAISGDPFTRFIAPYVVEHGRQGNEKAQVSHWLRDIFGNPFRPVAFSPEWRTSTAVGIAQGMYESQDFGAMPILADALQDAGCDSDDVLSHCRDTSATHVRGCWVVDLVLNKS